TSFALLFTLLLIPPPPRSTLFPYTTLFRSVVHPHHKTEESDQHRSEYHRMVTEKPFPGKGADDVRHDPEGGQDHDVHFRVTKNRSEEHTSELQSRENLVCRLLLEKKTQKTT